MPENVSKSHDVFHKARRDFIKLTHKTGLEQKATAAKKKQVRTIKGLLAKEKKLAMELRETIRPVSEKLLAMKNHVISARYFERGLNKIDKEIEKHLKKKSVKATKAKKKSVKKRTVKKKAVKKKNSKKKAVKKKAVKPSVKKKAVKKKASKKAVKKKAVKKKTSKKAKKQS